MGSFKIKGKKKKAAVSARPSQLGLADLLAEAVEHHRAGRLQAAEGLYHTILQQNPKHADALYLLGALANQCNQPETSVELIGRAIEINPNVPHYHYNRGVSLQLLARQDEAIFHYRQAVRLKADYAEAWDNLGAALQDKGDYSAAVQAHRRALQVNDRLLGAHRNLGTAYRWLGETESANRHFQRAIDEHPADIESRLKRAGLWLSQGQFRQGWQEYEWRHYSQEYRQTNPARVLPFPKWDGSSLAGKGVLIHAEQGIGDEVMYASCLPDLLAQAEFGVIVCAPRLVSLFERTFPEALVVPKPDASDLSWVLDLPTIDVRLPVESLPRFFRLAQEAFPRQNGYLKADPNLRSHWRQVLAGLGGGLKVGISWHGGIEPRAQSARSIALQQWQPLLTANGSAAFISLQYGNHAEEIEAFNRRCGGALTVLEGLDPMKDLDGFAALVAELDLVITIDNTTLHFAGALGVPAWGLLPILADPRWLLERQDSPWYASVRLFRARIAGIGGWREILEEIASELYKFSPQKTPCDLNLGSLPLPTQARSVVDSATQRPRAVFLNDTSSWYHWGCSCTSLAIHRKFRELGFSVRTVPIHQISFLGVLPQKLEDFDDDGFFAQFRQGSAELIDTLEGADLVIINGEGTLHGLNRAPLSLLYLAYIAKTKLGKNVQIINHSCYPDDSPEAKATLPFELYKKVYSNLDFVAVREPVSLGLIQAMGVEAVAAFDCLPLFIQHQYRPLNSGKKETVVLAGSVFWGGQSVPGLVRFVQTMVRLGLEVQVLLGANAYPAAEDFAFVQRLAQHCSGCFTLVNATSEAEWLATIGQARLLVSGRFHHSIAAAFLGTPFIVLESNTPKIEGLMQAFALDTLASVGDPNLADNLEILALRLLADPASGLLYPERQEMLRKMSRNNFMGLEKFSKDFQARCR